MTSISEIVQSLSWEEEGVREKVFQKGEGGGGRKGSWLIRCRVGRENSRKDNNKNNSNNNNYLYGYTGIKFTDIKFTGIKLF